MNASTQHATVSPGLLTSTHNELRCARRVKNIRWKNVVSLFLSLTFSSFAGEENAFMLIRKIVERQLVDIKDLYAVFISNPSKTVPVWHQRAARDRAYIFWDYHVIVLEARNYGYY